MEFRAFINDRIKSFRWLRITVRMAQYPATDEIKGFLIFQDINDQKTEELSVRKRLETDALTGVLNRSTFFAKVTELLQELPANKHAIVMVDLDNFKHINDTLGHVVGDKLLLRVASEIKSVLRSGDLIGRIGGDEFMICLKNIPFMEAIEKRADFICKMMQIEVADDIQISGSCGVALYPRDGKSFQELYQCADIAAYRAKQNGRNRYEVYSPSMEGKDPVLSTTPIDILNTGDGGERDYSSQIQDVVFNSEKLSVADAISNYLTAGIIIFEVQEDRLNTLYISPPYLTLEKNAKLSRVGGDALANVHPEDRARLFEDIKKCVSSGEICENIYRSNPEIGQYWFKGRTALIPYEDSEYPVLICVETDISEFVYQQEMLKKANDVLQTVDTVVGVFKMSLDQQLTVTFCNRRLIEMQGNSFEEKYAYGLKVSAVEYITESSRQELLNAIAQAQQEEKDYIELEIQLVTENRADKWVFVWGLLAQDTDGQQCLNGCAMDITESRAKIRNRVTEDVGQSFDNRISEFSNAQLRFIHEMSAIETFEVDIKTRTLSLSGGTLSKYAIDESKITNVPESMIERGTVHQDSAEVYRRLYEDIFAGKPEGDCIIKARRKTGQFALIRIVYRCLYDENGEAVKAVGISEQLENIADSRLRFEQEEKLNKLIRYDLIVFAKINLSTNSIEESQIPSQTGYTNDFYTDYTEAYTNLSRNIPNAEERAEYNETFSPEALKASFLSGEDWIYKEIRVCRADGSIQWTSQTVQLLASPLTGDIYAFIYIRNINDRKVQELSLGSTAEFDSTRTFYTRSTLQAIVDSALNRKKDEQVMMGIAIIKVHNLGEIIERFGSACIDRLMLSINRKLRYSIENRYVTARTANNDVVLFFNGVESRAQIMELGEYIMFILRNPSFYTTIPEQYAIYQTGAAVFRAKDADFDKLYRHALVSADKADIFKPYILYDDDSESYGYESQVRLVPGAEETMLDNTASLFSDSQTDDAIISKVAKILFTGLNTEQTINQVLSLVGNIFGAERAYILEVDNENQALNNTYEWCASGITSEKANLQQVPFTTIPTFFRAYQTNKTIVIEDVNALSEGNSEFNILKEQGIKSLCVSPHSVDGKVLGFLGIDNASLMKDNISLLNTISFFLMGELFKQRTTENERYMSRTDLLSGALSRNSYVEFIKAINVDSLTSMGVVMVNVSGLKELNKKYGNIYGDEVLKNAAQTIQEYCGKDCVFRYGGGTFVAMMQNLSFERFTQRVKELQAVFDKNVNYDVSVGHTWSDSVESVEKLVAEADMLMTYARREQNARQEKRKSAQTDSVVKELLAAIEKGYCKMYLQPKANTSDTSICGAEALVRIITPQHGIVYPGRFIPLLEDVGAVRYIDFFMLEQVFKLLDEWKKNGQPLMQISLNFSRSTLMEPGVVEAMLEIAEKYDVPREYVEIEITESFGDLQWETMRHIGSSIIRAGFKLSLDDFGAKYSNLSILASVPFSTVKLDKSLVDRIVSNTMSFFLVKSVVELCNTFNVNVVAEGVETQAQLEKLREMGCPCMQGYLLNKPLPVAEFESKYH